jgi:hypothetical protein
MAPSLPELLTKTGAPVELVAPWMPAMNACDRWLPMRVTQFSPAIRRAR